MKEGDDREKEKLSDPLLFFLFSFQTWRERKTRWKLQEITRSEKEGRGRKKSVGEAG